MSAEKLAKVDEAMEKLVEEKKLAGAMVVVARHGKIAHQQSYGMMDIEADKPMRDDAIFRIYSMSKAITSAAALSLVDDDKLALDDPASKYVAELRGVKVLRDGEAVAANNETTVRDLLRHTSGLTYGNYGDSEIDRAYQTANLFDRESNLKAMCEKLGKLPLRFEPGTDWQYGVSTDVLGRVIEVAANQPLDEFLKQRIFQPLDMRDTSFVVPAEKLDRFAANYTSAGDGQLALRDAPATSDYVKPARLFSGGGGLVSTTRDYLRFLLMIAAGGELHGVRILSPESVKLMTTNQLPETIGWIKFGDEVREGVGFGLGFSVRDRMSDWDPQGRVGEYGWGGAASTHYWVSPKDDLVVVTMEQTMPYSFGTEFAVKGLIYNAIERNGPVESTALRMKTLPMKTKWGEIRSAADRLELHVAHRPESGVIEIPRLNNPIGDVYFAAGESRQALALKPQPQVWSIELPEASDSNSLVIVIETKGAPRIAESQPTISSGADGAIVLGAHNAETHGDMLRYEPQPHKNTIGYWVNEDDWCQWRFSIEQPGKFDVYILQGCGTGQGGSEVEVRAAGQSIRFTVEDTGHFQNFKDRAVGAVTIDKAGAYTLQIRPLKKAAKAVMDVRQVRLVPAKSTN